MSEERQHRLAQFVAWSTQHITGDEKGQAQIFLDRLFQAFGQRGSLDVGGTHRACPFAASLTTKPPPHRACLFATLSPTPPPGPNATSSSANPLKDAHASLATLAAYGFTAKDDLLSQLLTLNLAVAARIESNHPVTAPGVPLTYDDPSQLITNDCIKP